MKKPTKEQIAQTITSHTEYFNLIPEFRWIQENSNYKKNLTFLCQQILEFINKYDHIIFDMEESTADYTSITLKAVVSPTQEDIDREYDKALIQYQQYKTAEKNKRIERENKERAELARLKKKYES